MDNLASGIVGTLCGWVLAQCGFYIQRRVTIRGDVSKAAYFLVVLLNEIRAIVSIKGSLMFRGEIQDKIVDKARAGLIGKSDFQKEIAAACERIAMIDMETACNVRNSCIMVDQIVGCGVNTLRKQYPDVAKMSEEMYLGGLKHEYYRVEQAAFHVLMACDVVYFLKFCRKIGWKQTRRHFLKRKYASSVSVEEINSLMSSVAEVVGDMDKKN